MPNSWTVFESDILLRAKPLTQNVTLTSPITASAANAAREPNMAASVL